MTGKHVSAATFEDLPTLEPFERNPRRWDDEALEKLAASLLRFGWARPVVCQASTRMICAGNRSWHAARLALYPPLRPGLCVLCSTDLAPKNALVWDKGDFGMGANWGNCYEMLGFFANLPREAAMSSKAERGQRVVSRGNILRYSRPTGKDRAHNAAKPLPLIAEVITLATDPGDVVGDLFGGSGQTLFACDRTGRVCVMVEKSAGWCDVIRRRWADWCEAEGRDPGPDALR